MLLFRSEEHLARWLRSHPHGSQMDVPTQWDLAKRWFAGRDRPDWRPRTPVQVEAVFREAGLGGDFWRMGRPGSDGSS